MLDARLPICTGMTVPCPLHRSGAPVVKLEPREPYEDSEQLAWTAAALTALVATVGMAVPSPTVAAGSSVTAIGVTYSTTASGWNLTQVTMSPDGLTTATTCSSTICIYCNGNGLPVNYATVTNQSASGNLGYFEPVGRCYPHRAHADEERATAVRLQRRHARR